MRSSDHPAVKGPSLVRMFGLFSVNGHVTDRGLLRAALALALALFGLFLAWRFLAGIATAVLVLLVGYFWRWRSLGRSNRFTDARSLASWPP